MAVRLILCLKMEKVLSISKPHGPPNNEFFLVSRAPPGLIRLCNLLKKEKESRNESDLMGESVSIMKAVRNACWFCKPCYVKEFMPGEGCATAGLLAEQPVGYEGRSEGGGANIALVHLPLTGEFINDCALKLWVLLPR